MEIKKSEIEDVFSEYPLVFRKKLLRLRKIILQVAEKSPEITELVETLKWGDPSYLPEKKNLGTTVRLAWMKSKPSQYGMYFNCQTNLIAKFKRKYPGVFSFEGNRAIIFQNNDVVPVKELKKCIEMALTYHLHKKRKK